MFSPLNALIVDDELLARRNLARMLESYCEKVHVAGEASSISATLQQLEKSSFDLIFLDIKLGKDDGFTLFDHLDKDRPAVIMTTAFSEFAVDAIEHQVFGYLVKPISPAKLVDTLSRFRDSRKGMNSVHGLESVAWQPVTEKIMLRSQKSSVLASLSELLYCRSDNYYTECVLISGEKVVVTKTLKWFEEELDGKGFSRIHNEYLVNLRHVKKLHHDAGLMVELSNGQQFEVSRRRRQQFQDRLKGVVTF